MAWEQVQTAVIARAGASGTATATYGQPPEEGSLLIAVLSLGALSTVTPPSGWTVDAEHNNGLFNAVKIYSKLCGPSEDDSPSWGISPSSDWVLTLLEYFGHDSGGDGNASVYLEPQVDSDGTNDTPTTGSMTLRIAGSMLVVGASAAGTETDWAGSGDWITETQIDATEFLSGFVGWKVTEGDAGSSETWSGTLSASLIWCVTCVEYKAASNVCCT